MEKIEVSWNSLWRILIMLSFAMALFFIRDILLVFLAAIVVSAAIDAPLTYLESRKIPRILGLLFIFLAVLAAIIVILYTLVPVAVIELKNLLSHLDELEKALGGILGISALTANLDEFLKSAGGMVLGGSAPLLKLIPDIFQNIVLIVTTIVVSFYLALNRAGIENFLRAVLPPVQEDYAIEIYHRVRAKIGKWLKGQVILSLAVGFLTFISLKILGVKFSLILGILAGIFEIIPYIGPLITGFLVFLMAVTQSFNLGILVIIVFMLIQQLESHILIPIVMRKTVGIHPVIVLFALLAGAKLAGIVGILLAVPVAVVFQEIVEEWASHKRRRQQLI